MLDSVESDRGLPDTREGLGSGRAVEAITSGSDDTHITVDQLGSSAAAHALAAVAPDTR